MGETSAGRPGGGESLTGELVTKIAEKQDVDQSNLRPPIGNSIDLDAVERLFSGRQDGFAAVEFTYSGYQITIAGEEELEIEVE